MKPIAYEGKEPYIFISYAHRDSERVFEVLNELQDQGYRFWYDDGIAPGSEWPEDIARHLDGSAMVIAFVTPNSMKSQNCRREINFSLSREKPFLSVILEETDMPLGMQMQLSAQQSILRYNYDSWGGFINKILACPDIAPCLAPPEPQPQTVPLPSRPEAGPATTPDTPALVTSVPAAEAPAEPAEEYHEVEVVPPTSEPAPEPAPAKRKLPKLGGEKKAKADKKPKAVPTAGAAGAAAGKKLPIPLIAGAVALVVLAIVAFTMLTGDFTTSWGEKVSKGESYIYVSGEKLTQDDLTKIAGLKKLDSLTFEHCDFSDCDFAGLTFASDTLDNLSLSGSTGVNDCSFLSNLTLDRLYLVGQEAFSDLSSLDVSQLMDLDVSGTSVTDLTPLAETDIYKLGFAYTEVSDLSPLSSMEKLQNVDGSYTKVTDVNPLAGLTNLDAIAFDGCKVGAVKQEFASLKLRDVSLAQADITNLAGLANCTTLRNLNLSDNKNLASMDWLDAQNYATLKELNFSRTKLAADNLAWVANCPELTSLKLDGIALNNLAFCANLGKLEVLSAVNCGLEDISGLSGCPALRIIKLSCNKISDVSQLNLKLDNRVTLELMGNQLTTVEGLPEGKYQAIMLYANAADNVAATLPAGVEAFEIVTPYFEGIETSTLAGSSRFTSIYVVGCPQNQVLNVQDGLGYFAKFITEDELFELCADDAFDYSTHVDYGYILSVIKGESSSYVPSEVVEEDSTSTGMPSITPVVPYGG